MVGLFALAGCVDSQPKCVQPGWVTYATVTDANGAPVDGLAFHTVRMDTGKDITPALDPIFEVQRDGRYPIVDDSTGNLLGDHEVSIAFTVSGESGSGSISGVARASDDGCPGAVYLGPTQITLGPR